jgi:hypothetical protein
MLLCALPTNTPIIRIGNIGEKYNPNIAPAALAEAKVFFHVIFLFRPREGRGAMPREFPIFPAVC